MSLLTRLHDIIDDRIMVHIINFGIYDFIITVAHHILSHLLHFDSLCDSHAHCLPLSAQSVFVGTDRKCLTDTVQVAGHCNDRSSLRDPEHFRMALE